VLEFIGTHLGYIILKGIFLFFSGLEILPIIAFKAPGGYGQDNK
jgi:hypothetical protein